MKLQTKLFLGGALVMLLLCLCACNQSSEVKNPTDSQESGFTLQGECLPYVMWEGVLYHCAGIPDNPDQVEKTLGTVQEVINGAEMPAKDGQANFPLAGEAEIGWSGGKLWIQLKGQWMELEKQEHPHSQSYEAPVTAEGTETGTAPQWECLPYVMWEGVLYHCPHLPNDPDQIEKPLGTVQEVINGVEMPEKDGQANFPLAEGAEIGLSGGKLWILLKGQWVELLEGE